MIYHIYVSVFQVSEAGVGKTQIIIIRIAIIIKPKYRKTPTTDLRSF